MAQSDDNAIAAFARAAEEYCTWADAAPGDSASEARAAQRLLLDLIRRAIALPAVISYSIAADISPAEYERVYRRFDALPFSYYSICSDPLVVPSDAPAVADLGEDLADIWRDLRAGLLLWHEGRITVLRGTGGFTFTHIGVLTRPRHCTRCRLGSVSTLTIWKIDPGFCDATRRAVRGVAIMAR